MRTSGFSRSTYSSAFRRCSGILKSQPVVRSIASPTFMPNLAASFPTRGGENTSHTSTAHSLWTSKLGSESLPPGPVAAPEVRSTSPCPLSPPFLSKGISECCALRLRGSALDPLSTDAESRPGGPSYPNSPSSGSPWDDLASSSSASTAGAGGTASSTSPSLLLLRCRSHLAGSAS